MKCPCKGCDHRKLGCHGICKDYQAWKKEDEDKKKWLNEQKPMINDSAIKGQREKIKRIARGWNGKRGSTKDYGG